MLNFLPAPLHRLGLNVAHNIRIRVWRIFKPHLNSVSIIGMTPDNKILLVRLSYGRQHWEFPGGGIRANEEPEAAARRELLEETGCEAGKLKLVERFEETVVGTRCTTHLYTTTLLDAPKSDDREIVEARFFPAHSLPEPLSGKTRKRLAMLKDKQSQSPDAKAS